MESENDREREPLRGCIFDDFGAIWDPPKRSKIDKNGRVTLTHSVLVLVCVGFLDLDPILIDFDLIWIPIWILDLRLEGYQGCNSSNLGNPNTTGTLADQATQ